MLNPEAGKTLSRRTMLRSGLLGGIALATLPWPGLSLTSPGRDEPLSYNDLFDNPPLLGRVEAQWEILQKIVRQPDAPDDTVRITRRHEVLPIYGAAHADAPTPALRHNDVWFDVGDGYIHSSYVIPVREIFNEPEEIGDGFWGEITVPEFLLQWQPQRDSRGKYRLAYGTVYWVAERVDDAEGRAWYRLVDDGLHRAWWIEARCVHRLRPDELFPISPNVPPDCKQIVISISQQLLTCLEDDLPVFSTRISSGTAYINPEGKQFGFNTPIGKHQVVYKRPSRHMTGGDPQNATNHYDLPGVPWCTYFTPTGAAIHGTYWHNNYGRRASHGCVNVTNDAARWIYRWVNPVTDYDAPLHWTTREEAKIATVVSIQE
ncbi:MAG: L,D-transpeptidase [Anaerolineae bacterium]|nr:L,D-transpeptidase [Anaerolineae bacterium]